MVGGVTDLLYGIPAHVIHSGKFLYPQSMIQGVNPIFCLPPVNNDVSRRLKWRLGFVGILSYRC